LDIPRIKRPWGKEERYNMGQFQMTEGKVEAFPGRKYGVLEKLKSGRNHCLRPMSASEPQLWAE
jgi:hypothetical protein